MTTESFDGGSYRVVKEKLNGNDTDLTSFYFHRGANVYIFSYQKDGVKKHTFIDAGDSQYQKQILGILAENDVDYTNIERIIITHRHPDHCGLAYTLARESKAKIVAHSNFRSFVEGEINQEERGWLGDFHPSQLQECEIEYLFQSNKSQLINIGGVDFQGLAEPIEIGEAGQLQILACPESKLTHSPDQIAVLYSPRDSRSMSEETHNDFHSVDNMLFSGDLWLMRGPMFDWGIGHAYHHLKQGIHQMRGLMAGKGMIRRDPREQDTQAKEALKRGFSLIRVKPGHGEEFLGSRILPNSLLTDRDLLFKLGYPMSGDKSILKTADMAPKVAVLIEQSYANFAEELMVWSELGYTSTEISEFLVRIYSEQRGGGSLVEQDRIQRRERLKTTLDTLKGDQNKSDELRQMAESTLAKIGEIS